MANYEEKLLAALAEKYRRSKKDTGTNKIVRRTKVTPEALYKHYHRNDGDMGQIQAVNETVRRCQERGFVTGTWESFSDELREIVLVDEKVQEIESYLQEKYGYEPKAAKKRRVEEIIAAYGGRSKAAERECQKLRQALDKNKIPPKYQQTEELLKALVFIEHNQRQLFLREASLLIYGDSKYLEENTLSAVCRTLREYLNRPCSEEEIEDEILEDYHILREKQRLCLKGSVTLHMAGEEVCLDNFSGGIEFFSQELERIEKITVHAPYFMTVENYTSWLRLQKPDTAYFYLGGYANRCQRDFLKRVFQDNPGLSFRHFGDIDAGGLYIYEHLRRVTGIPFDRYRMSRAELEDARYQACLQPLTEQDRVRLQSLAGQEPYRELAEYMLKKNVKLEQEIVSFFE